MAAAGAEGVPETVEALRQAEVGWCADVLTTRTVSDAVDGIAGSSAETSRLLFELEAAWERFLASEAKIAPHAAIVLRHDGGDAETGFGLEFGGGIRFEDSARGFSVSVDGNLPNAQARLKRVRKQCMPAQRALGVPDQRGSCEQGSQSGKTGCRTAAV